MGTHKNSQPDRRMGVMETEPHVFNKENIIEIIFRDKDEPYENSTYGKELLIYFCEKLSRTEHRLI